MSGFTGLFGSGALLAAGSYQALTLTAPTAMSWPIEGAVPSTILAALNDITPIGAGAIILPPATQAGAGAGFVLNNRGGIPLPVFAQDGTTSVASVPPGVVYGVYLTSNATANGTWRSFTLGAGVAQGNILDAVGLGLISTGGTLATALSAQDIAAASYTISAANRAQLLVATGGATTWTLPKISTLPAGFFVGVRNSGSGNLSLALTGDALEGANPLTPGQSTFLVADPSASGNTWRMLGLGSNAGNGIWGSTGYIQMPGNGVFQWTNGVTNSNGQYTFTFPYPYQNGCWLVVPALGSANPSAFISYSGASKTSVDIFICDSAGVGQPNSPFSVFVLGN